MKLHCYPETDSLSIELNTAESAETREVTAGVNLDFDPGESLVGIDIDAASESSTSRPSRPAPLPFRTINAA